jgi:hypothetical protein
VALKKQIAFRAMLYNRLKIVEILNDNREIKIIFELFNTNQSFEKLVKFGILSGLKISKFEILRSIGFNILTIEIEFYEST